MKTEIFVQCICKLYKKSDADMNILTLIFTLPKKIFFSGRIRPLSGWWVLMFRHSFQKASLHIMGKAISCKIYLAEDQGG